MPRRRVRVNRETTLVTTSDRNKVKKLVDLVAGNLLVIEAAQKENKPALKELDDLMKSLSMKEFTATKGDALYITPASRESSIIQVSAFKDAVTEEEFMECITVGKAKAKKVLSERELEAISKTVPGKDKEAVLTITTK